MYTPPEVLAAADGDTYDGAALDVWSCGVVLYTLMFGGHPFVSPEDLARARAGGGDSRVVLASMMTNSMSGGAGAGGT